MAEFIGQTKLKEVFAGYTLQQLPKTFMFLGETGCGKHTFAKIIAKNFGLEFTEINKNLEDDLFAEYKLSPVPTLYFIDMTDMFEKAQNKFLKFIEEPGNAAYICISVISEAGILPTILNRCIKYTFEPYTIEELRQVKYSTDDRYVYKVFNTPGLLLSADTGLLIELRKLCEKIVDNIQVVSYPHFLSILLKINYKEEYDKFDFYSFFNMLKLVAFDKYVSDKNIDAYKIYMFANNRQQKLRQYIVAKEIFMTKFLTELWEEFHDTCGA